MDNNQPPSLPWNPLSDVGQMVIDFIILAAIVGFVAGMFIGTVISRLNAPDSATLLKMATIESNCIAASPDTRPSICTPVISHAMRCAEEVGEPGRGCTADDTYEVITRAGFALPPLRR